MVGWGVGDDVVVRVVELLVGAGELIRPADGVGDVVGEEDGDAGFVDRVVGVGVGVGLRAGRGTVLLCLTAGSGAGPGALPVGA